MTRSPLRLVPVLAMMVLAACEKASITPGNPFAVALEISAGDGQSAAVGQALPLPLMVRVLDEAGAAVAGATVEWLVVSGGGTVTATSASDAQGIAMATYTAGPTVGPKSIRGRLQGGPDSAAVTFAATITAGPASRLQKTAGDAQTIAPGTPSNPLEVTVTDAFGNPVSGVMVNWAVTAGSATPNPASGPTDSQGRARTTVTATGSAAVTVTATSTGLTGSPATFSATVNAILLVNTIPVPDLYALHDQYVRGGLAFLNAWNTGLLIYDVGDGRSGGSPANPQLVGQIVTSARGIPGGPAVHNAWWFWNPTNGEKKYVFVGQEGPASLFTRTTGDIHVVDVTNMANPVEVAFYRMPQVGGQDAGVHNFWMDEAKQILYAAYYNGGIVALDVSGTLNGDLAGRELAVIRPSGIGSTFIWGVQLYNGSLYATDMRTGFWQIALTPAGLFGAVAGGNNVPERYGSDQWVHGGYAYSGTWGNRGAPGNALKIWQLNAAGAPVLVDSIIRTGVGTVSDVEVTADGALLMFSAEGGTSSARGFYFYRLTDPARPTFAGFYPVSTGVHTATFATIGGRLYAFGAKDPPQSALVILDVTALLP